MDIHLGIACPMANEEATCTEFVQALLSECSKYPFRQVSCFVVVDSASKDRTRERLAELAATEERLRVVWAPENRSIVDAYVRGYREAIHAGCDWILEIDAGFSHDPADASKFFAKMAEGYDCVFGTRMGAGGSFEDVSLKRRTISRLGTIATNVLLGTRLTDMTSGYELFTREALEMVLSRGIRSKAHFFQTEIKVFCRNLKCAEVPISYRHPNPNLSNAAVMEAMARLGSLVILRLSGRL
jgi:dolichol-phosphate mannosyltransferase